MRSWCLLTDGRVRRVAWRGGLGLAVLVASSTFGACAGDSKSKRAPSTDGTDAAGAGNNSAPGGVAGSGSSGVEQGGTVSDTPGSVNDAPGSVSDASGSVSDASAGGGGATGDATDATSGAAGATSGTDGLTGSSGADDNMSDAAATGGGLDDAAATAVEGSRGADGGCLELCSNSSPACCTQELSCVERVPRCRIDVLADDVGVIYEYADLEAEIGTRSGTVEFTIPLGVVERAAADPPPAARFELTLAAGASTDLAALADVFAQPFRLLCDEQELFVGVVYLKGGAAAIRTPVLHVEPAEDGALVLRLGAWQGAWALSGDGGAAELRERLDRAELRVQLCERGILDEFR